MSRASRKAGSSTTAKSAKTTKTTKSARSAKGGKGVKSVKGVKDVKSVKGKRKAAKAPLATREMAAVVVDEEPMSQVTLKMRESQHRQLAKMAFNQGTTMRGVIMRALKAAGLRVTKQDLVDRRRR